jgi:hypothetical protein
VNANTLTPTLSRLLEMGKQGSQCGT